MAMASTDPDQQSLFDVASQVSAPDPFAGHRPVTLPKAGARIRYQAPEGVRSGVIWCAAPGNHVWVTPTDGAPRFERVAVWATTRPGNVRGELSQGTVCDFVVVCWNGCRSLCERESCALH